MNIIIANLIIGSVSTLAYVMPCPNNLTLHHFQSGEMRCLRSIMCNAGM